MQIKITKEFISTLKELIANEQKDSALELIQDMHPYDIAEVLAELEIEEAVFLYLILDSELAADVIVELEEDDREKVLRALPSDIIAHRFIDNMDSDDAADIIGELPDDKKEEVLSHIDDVEQAGDIVDLLSYDENSAGGLMAKELIKVNANWDVLTCLREMRKQAEEVDEVFYVYVIDNEKKLNGTLSLKKLLTSPTSVKVRDICDFDVISVKTDTSSEEVAKIMEKYDLVALPVMDAIGRLVGRITIDDVVDVIREEAEKDYQMVSGLSDDVEPSDTVWRLTRARIPWLIIGLIGGILGALVLGGYEEELSKFASVAFFIPLIAAMAGNAGVQSSAIVVQSLASNSLDLSGTGAKLLKELSVALLNGIICSVLIFGFTKLFYDNIALTYSVSAALFIVMVYASVFGTFIPLALHRFKIDPAMATGPFITTMNDIMGLFIYLVISQYFFEMLTV